MRSLQVRTLIVKLELESIYAYLLYHLLKVHIVGSSLNLRICSLEKAVKSKIEVWSLLRGAGDVWSWVLPFFHGGFS